MNGCAQLEHTPLPNVMTVSNTGDVPVPTARAPDNVTQHEVDFLPCAQTRLIDLYNSYFEIAPVETANQLIATFRVRYEVYCVENAFEDPAGNPCAMETDAFDAGSLHSLLLRREDGEVIGTVRLIMPVAQSGMEGTGLPIRDVCGHELVQCNNPVLPWSTTAEISRFAVSKKSRRRASDQSTVGGFVEPDGTRRRIPDASLGLMQAIVAMAAKAGVTHLCAIMEPSLLRMLARFGIHFRPLGPLVNYHGVRQPCYAECDELVARAWTERREVWELLTRGGVLWPDSHQLAAKLVPARPHRVFEPAAMA